MTRQTVIAWLAAQFGLAEYQPVLKQAIRFGTIAGERRSFEEWGAAKELWQPEHVSLLAEAFLLCELHCRGCGCVTYGFQWRESQQLHCVECGGNEFESRLTNEARRNLRARGFAVETDSTPTPPAGTVTDLERPLEPGDVLASWRIAERIVERGQGVVYRAEHVMLHWPVAVKVIRRDAMGDEAARERFRREASVLSGFDHPHIVNVLDYGEIGDGAYLVLQWMDGRGFDERTKALIASGEAVPIAEVVRVYIAVAKALDAAHNVGVIHRDVKPENVLMGHDGQVKLADFGGVLVEDVAESKVIGSVPFMAPEVFRNQYTPSVDLYSLGCSIYQSLTGTNPFRGEAGAVMQAHWGKPFPDVREVRPDVPAALAELLQQLCAKQPEQRPASAAAVVDKLEHLLLQVESQQSVGRLPLPIARARRDYYARLGTPMALPAAHGYVDAVLQTLVAMAAAPLVPAHGPLPPDVAAALRELHHPTRSGRWLLTLHRLLKLHKDRSGGGDGGEMPEVARTVRRFAKAATPAWSMLEKAVRAVAANDEEIRGLVERMEKSDLLLAWATPLTCILDNHLVSPGSSEAQALAVAIGAALDRLLDHSPDLPEIVWVLVVGESANHVAVQQLVGDRLPNAHDESLSPVDAQLVQASGGAGLFVRTDGRLAPLAPLIDLDDAEWYSLTAFDGDTASYTCTTTGHVLRRSTETMGEGPLAVLRGAFVKPLAEPPVERIVATSSDLRNDVQRLQSDWTARLAQAAHWAHRDPKRSIEASASAIEAMLAEMLAEPHAKRARGSSPRLAIGLDVVDQLRFTDPPRVPLTAVALIDLARRARMRPSPEGVALALFAAVRLTLWWTGSASMMLSFNPQRCLAILAPPPEPSQVAGADDETKTGASTFKRGNRRLGAQANAGLESTMLLAQDGSDAAAAAAREAGEQLAGLTSTRRNPRERHAQQGSPQASASHVRLQALGPTLEPSRDEIPLPTQLGKRPTCRPQIPSPYVSRIHAELRRDNAGALQLTHLARTNTTSVNACKLTLEEEVQLKPHDIIMLDTETFLVLP